MSASQMKPVMFNSLFPDAGHRIGVNELTIAESVAAVSSFYLEPELLVERDGGALSV